LIEDCGVGWTDLMGVVLVGGAFGAAQLATKLTAMSWTTQVRAEVKRLASLRWLDSKLLNCRIMKV